jgi:hypothetical protein
MRRFFRFTLRDLIWLTVVAAIAAAWWQDHRTQSTLRHPNISVECPIFHSASTAHASPDAVFAAAKTALNRQDWKSYFHCLTPESRDGFAAKIPTLAIIDAQLSDFFGREQDAKIIQTTLEKHGLTKAAIVKSWESDDPQRAARNLLNLVADRDAFLADFFTALCDLESTKGKPKIPNDATLRVVRIDDGSATGMVEYVEFRKKKSEAINFKRMDGSWRLDFAKGCPSFLPG